MTAREKPSTCRECVEYHDPPRVDGPKTDTYNCSPKGTHWRLLLKGDHKACGSIHAVKRHSGRPDQGALL